MYAVIFRARFKAKDSAYDEMAERMRTLAKDKYGCTGFSSVRDGNSEISVSYWNDEEQIEAWKHDSEHLAAQELGKQKWYASYHIEVVAVLRAYGSA